MSKKFQNVPSWFHPVLQGLSYWIGYKKQFFWRYHFSEGALASELYTLFNAKKNDNCVVFAEFPYEKMHQGYKITKSNKTTKKSDGRGRPDAVDILVIEDDMLTPKDSNDVVEKIKRKKKYDEFINIDKKDKKYLPKKINLFLFEIKRIESLGKINQDIKKINDYLKKNKTARGFLILVSQDAINDKVTIKKHKILEAVKSADKKNQKNIPKIKILTDEFKGDDFSFKVRKVCKALNTNSLTHRSIFTILIEIIPVD